MDVTMLANIGFTSFEMPVGFAYFVSVALQNPAPKTKELSKKKVQSRQKSAASVAESEKKEKSFKLAVKQGRWN